MLEMTTLPYVKSLAGITGSDTSGDAVLERLIEAVSKQAETYMRRSVLTERVTEYFDCEDGVRRFDLANVPVSTINGTGEGVWNDLEWEFSTALATSAYHVNMTKGILYLVDDPMVGPDALKVVYTGGMAADVSAFMATYHDLSEAIARQVLFMYNTRKSIGADSVSIGPASVSWRGDVAWMVGVKEVLDCYRI